MERMGWIGEGRRRRSGFSLGLGGGRGIIRNLVGF